MTNLLKNSLNVYYKKTTTLSKASNYSFQIANAVPLFLVKVV